MLCMLLSTVPPNSKEGPENKGSPEAEIAAATAQTFLVQQVSDGRFD
jgi:hypothetical protein